MSPIAIVADVHGNLPALAAVVADLERRNITSIVSAHSHMPRLVQASDTMLIVNPGSVGVPAYEDTETEPHHVENGSPHARYAVVEQHEGEWQATFVSVTYDFLSATRQAEANGRLDWAIALRTGYTAW